MNGFRGLAINTSLLALSVAIENKSGVAFSESGGKGYLDYSYPKFTKFENNKMIEITKVEFESILKNTPHNAIAKK